MLSLIEIWLEYWEIFVRYAIKQLPSTTKSALMHGVVLDNVKLITAKNTRNGVRKWRTQLYSKMMG